MNKTREDYHILIERIENPAKGDKYILNLGNESNLKAFELSMLSIGEKIIAKGISKLEVEELFRQGVEEV